MFLIPEVKGKNVGVFGLGVSGVAACQSLAASGANVFSYDQNAAARDKTANTNYRCEHPKSWPWKDMDAVMVSPGVPLTHPKPHAIVKKATAEKIPVIGDTELFARTINALPENARPRVVGVTGSNGKSTTAALIGHILKEAGEDVCVGGNIGEAALSMPAPEKDKIYVLELSSFQLDLTHSLRLNAAVFLNLTPDHIDRHGSVGDYFAAKKRIFLNQLPGDAAVIGVDDDYGENLCTELIARNLVDVVPVSACGTLGRGVYALDGDLFYNLEGKTARAGGMEHLHALRGVHNHQNVAAAAAVCARFGVSPTLSLKAAERFESLPHRMEQVARIGRVSFVNDSKATNADAAARAINAYDDVFWIVGGKAKEGGVASLLDKVGKVRKAYLIGEAASEFEAQLISVVDCVICGDMQTAVAKASEDAATNEAKSPTVLLSPACASFDQYKNFEARGEAFRAAVEAIPQANGEAA